MTEKTQPLSQVSNRLRRMASYASAAVAITLIAAKLVAYLVTDSVAMLSSLLDSTMDLISSIVTICGVASAMRPPDHDHRFGHGKAEPLAALAQAAFIVGSSVLLGYQALSRFYHPHPIQNENFGYGVMVAAILLTAILVRFQHYVVHRTSSLAITADRLHYIGDLIINVAVIMAFALQQATGKDWFDPAFALIISVGLSITAFRIAMHAMNILMDRELPEEDRARLQAIVKSNPAVRGMHDMRTRSDSDRIFMEVHVEMDADMTLREAHDISESIETEVQKAFPGADIIIHQDPAGLSEPKLDKQIEASNRQRRSS